MSAAPSNCLVKLTPKAALLVPFSRFTPWGAAYRGGYGVGVGYRVYFSRRAEVVYLLLVGGDKSSQKRDIKRAIEMARALDKE